jgi:hypothetical protein
MSSILGYSAVLVSGGTSHPFSRRICYRTWEEALKVAQELATAESGRIDARILSCLKSSSQNDCNVYGHACIYTIRSHNGTAEVYLVTNYDGSTT